MQVHAVGMPANIEVAVFDADLVPMEGQDRLPHLDLVCLDDVQLAAGSADWERALFGLYRELEESGGSSSSSIACQASSSPQVHRSAVVSARAQ